MSINLVTDIFYNVTAGLPMLHLLLRIFHKMGNKQDYQADIKQSLILVYN